MVLVVQENFLSFLVLNTLTWMIVLYYYSYCKLKPLLYLGHYLNFDLAMMWNLCQLLFQLSNDCRQGCQVWTLNGTNPGLFKIFFQYILAKRDKMYWKLILQKSQICPFWSYLDLHWAKSDIPVCSYITCIWWSGIPAVLPKFWKMIDYV